MAIKITDDCINCGACEIKCPNQAIYEASANWSFSGGSPAQKFRKLDGSVVSGEEPQSALSDSVYYIVPDKCTECVGFHDEPQCVSVCPVESCVPDPQHPESREYLEEKKEKLRVKPHE